MPRLTVELSQSVDLLLDSDGLDRVNMATLAHTISGHAGAIRRTINHLNWIDAGSDIVWSKAVFLGKKVAKVAN